MGGRKRCEIVHNLLMVYNLLAALIAQTRNEERETT